MRQQRIDELTRRDHYYLGDGDVCYFFGEYSARKGRSFSDTNELIVNISMPVKLRDTAKWARKDRAVQKLAQLFRAAFAPDQVSNITFVPLPPALPKDHPEYDDRMSCVLRAMGDGLDVREMIELMSTRESKELSTVRMGPDALFTNMHVVQALLDPVPEVIFLVGDVLVTGANFVAAKRRLQQLLPRVPVCGLFAVRKLLETDEFDDPAKFQT
jgi:hypothetical protein